MSIKTACLCRRRKSWIPILFTGAIVGACDRPMNVEPVRSVQPRPSVTGAPIRDKVMGPLSDLARHVVAGLQDPAVRGRLVRAMKDSSMTRRGLDLLDCDATAPLGAVLAAAEKRGGRSRALLCSSIRQSRGLTLYMDPDRLAGWDSTVIPIVTAVADPNQAIPNSFLGYRSPSETIDLPRDGSVGGPILVILPHLHRGRFASQRARLLPADVMQLKSHQDSVLPAQRSHK